MCVSYLSQSENEHTLYLRVTESIYPTDQALKIEDTTEKLDTQRDW